MDNVKTQCLQPRLSPAWKHKERAEAFPTHGPPPSMILYVYEVFFSTLPPHWKINQRHPKTEREKNQTLSSTFPLFCPLLSLLALQQVGKNSMLCSRLDQLVTAEFTWGWPFFYQEDKDSQWHTASTIILSIMTVLSQQRNNRYEEPAADNS